MTLTETRGKEIAREAAVRTSQLEAAIVHVAALRHHLVDLDRESVQLSNHGLYAPSITGAVAEAEARARAVVEDLVRCREIPDMPNPVRPADHLPALPSKRSKVPALKETT